MEKKRVLSRVLSFYVTLFVISLLAYLWINSIGTHLFPTELNTVPDQNLGHFNQTLHILLALAVVIAVSQLLGKIFAYVRQPAVIGEVLGGVLLGPSLLGKVAPELTSYILPAATAPFLSIIAQIGIILYMFIVGLELDLKVLKQTAHATVAISHSSIVFPFILGALLSLGIYEELAPPGVNFTVFSLFLGASLSVTAFPVLARILSAKNLSKTPLGIMALTCAAIDDVTAWCLLALVVSIAHSELSTAITTLILTAVYICFMLLIMRPLVRKGVMMLEKMKNIAEGELAIIFLAVLISALATEYIGIHAIFGAFLLGAIVPHQSHLAHDLTYRLEDVVRVLFLPAFFAFTGMRTEIGLINSLTDWSWCSLIILVAVAGKFGGTLISARFTGSSWRDSAALGILMNTRGLVELIVLNIGLDLKIISARLFTMLVVMALVTTFMTGPLLDMILRRKDL